MKTIDLSKYDLTDPNLLVSDIAKMEGYSVSGFYLKMKQQGIKIGRRGTSDKAKAAMFGRKTKKRLNDPFSFHTTRLYKTWRAGALTRDKEFKITYEEFIELYNKQNGLCALSGSAMKIDEDTFDMSMDRINSDLDYTLDNVQLVIKQVNYMKQSYTQEEFVNLCKLIANKHA